MYPGTDSTETFFVMKVAIEGGRIDATLYADEVFVIFDTPKGKDSESLKVMIDKLKRNKIKQSKMIKNPCPSVAM